MIAGVDQLTKIMEMISRWNLDDNAKVVIAPATLYVKTGSSQEDRQTHTFLAIVDTSTGKLEGLVNEAGEVSSLLWERL